MELASCLYRRSVVSMQSAVPRFCSSRRPDPCPTSSPAPLPTRCPTLVLPVVLPFRLPVPRTRPGVSAVPLLRRWRPILMAVALVTDGAIVTAGLMRRPTRARLLSRFWSAPVWGRSQRRLATNVSEPRFVTRRWPAIRHRGHSTDKMGFAIKTMTLQRLIAATR